MLEVGCKDKATLIQVCIMKYTYEATLIQVRIMKYTYAGSGVQGRSNSYSSVHYEVYLHWCLGVQGRSKSSPEYISASMLMTTCELSCL